jgi:hypothetical protein
MEAANYEIKKELIKQVYLFILIMFALMFLTLCAHLKLS